MKPNLSYLSFSVAVFAFAASIAVADDANKPAAPPSAAQPPANLPAGPPSVIIPTDYLVLSAVGQYGRLPLHRDAVEAEIVAGTWKPPASGQTVKAPDGKMSMWSAVKAAADGSLDTPKLRGGYAFASFDSPADRVMLVEAAGDAMVYVNGEPHAGDTYNLDWLRLPVAIKKGQNTLLFHLGADKLKARLVSAPDNAVFFDESERTIPTLVRNEIVTSPIWAAIPIVNASREWLEGATIECVPSTGVAKATPVAVIPPLSVRKVGFQLPALIDQKPSEVKLQVRLLNSKAAKDPGKTPAAPRSETEITVKRADPHETHIRTFRSKMDGSIQMYAIRPASEPTAPQPADGTKPALGQLPGLIVTLHSAGTPCDEHVAQYAPKSWAHVIAPQGRGPYGFDWESWSREDVLEAVSDAQAHYPFDLRRVYLTGHSMGGHGVWHIGVTWPDQFAAIGPSSGWISYWSYGGGMPSTETASSIEALMLRGHNASDSLKLLTNLTNVGVYVLHGAADQTVPVAQARFMRTRLATFHPNFVYYEQAGADHWWGTESCDWPPMMDYFRQQSSDPPADRTYIDFTTANPAVSASCDWVSIEAQQEQLNLSHVAICQNAKSRTFVGNTSNVARLSIDVAHLSPNEPIDVTLDGQPLNWLKWPGESHKLWFERQGDSWSIQDAPEPGAKNPTRYGTFNSAFDNNAVLVYGTGGNDEENAWAASKARYDAETFYYRGGGALEVLPDSKFDFNKDTNRNVIVYGNADTNRAWPQLLSSSPVEVRRGKVRVGTRTETSDSLAVLAVRPRPGSDTASVGIVAGTGPAGMRLTNRLRWFIAGVVYPDVMILEPKILTDGTAGVRACGYFGLDWGPETGEIAWRN
jgi:dienelactone hydrolase